VTRQQRRRFLIGLTALVLMLFAGGIAVGFAQRNDKLCSDGKPPKAQQDPGFGQIKYLCHNGQIVAK
jgi:hypothetical protein